MNHLNKILCLFLIALICACGKKNDDNPIPPGNQQENPNINPTPTPTPDPVPTKSSAVLPENGDVCSDYSTIQNEPENINVFFKWTSSENTTSYSIQVFESEIEVYNGTGTVAETEIVLEKGKTYSWQIKSINATSETLSDTFSFSTPGETIANYVPYAAEIDMTFNTSANTLIVSWQGSDEDNDTLVYDITIKEGDVELVNEVDITTDNYGPIDAISGMVYTVEVVSKDPAGNISISTQSRLMD